VDILGRLAPKPFRVPDRSVKCRLVRVGHLFLL
jgi:hypothetical protein